MKSNDLFISYSRKDKEFVRKLAEGLRTAGHDPWVDWEDIPPSVDWMQEIERGIESANAFIFIISPDSVDSKVCYAEMEHAAQHNKRLVPILHREVEMPKTRGRDTSNTNNPLDRVYSALGMASDKERMMAKLSPHNWIFMRETDDFQTGLKAVLEALVVDQDYVQMHTRLLLRAREWESKNRDSSFTLRGRDLVEAEHWLNEVTPERDPQPTPAHLTLIAASRKVQRLRRRVQVGIAVYGLVVLLLAIFAFAQLLRANRQRQLAEEAQDDALQSAAEARTLALASSSLIALNEGNTDQAIGLALEAARSSPRRKEELERILANVAYIPGTVLRIENNAEVFSAAVSPDGKMIASGDALGSVILWDAATGKERRRLLGQAGSVEGVAFSPDNRYLAAGSQSGTVIIWDIQSGEIAQRLEGHFDAVNAVAFSRDGQQLASAADDLSVVVWDVRTGQALHRLEGHFDRVTSVAFSPTQDYLVSGSEDFTLILWDAVTGESLLRFEDHIGGVTSVAFSPDGRFIASGSRDTTINIWGAETGEIGNRLYGHNTAVTSVAFSPDGKQLLSAGEDGTSVLWDSATGYQLATFKGHRGPVWSVAFMPQVQGFVSASADTTLRRWDTVDREVIHIMRNPEGAIAAVGLSFHPNGRTALAVSIDGSLALWDTETGSLIRQFSAGDAYIYKAVFDHTGQYILSASEDGAVTIWEAATGEILRQLKVEDAGTFPMTVAISPEDRWALAGTNNGELYLWDFASGDLLHRYPMHDDGVSTAFFLPDGQSALSASYDGTLKVWQVETGEVLRTFTTNGRPTDAVADARLITREGHVITDAELSPDGKYLAASFYEGIAVLWDFASGEMLRVLEGHNGLIYALAFSPDSQSILTASQDNTARLWSATTGQEIRRFDGHVNWVPDAIFRPDGAAVLTASYDTTLRLWRLEDLETLIAWTCANRFVPELPPRERERFQLPPAEEPLCPPSGVSGD